MTIFSFRTAPFRLSLALSLVAFAACSSSDGSEAEPGDGTEQVEPPGEAGAPNDAPEPGEGGSGGGSSEPEPSGGSDSKGGRSPGGAGGDESSAGSTGEGTAGESGDPEPQPPSEAFLRGQALVEEAGCATCHQANFAGFTVFPNITPDAKTGIGSWTDEQIIAAIRDGIDVDGSKMCVTMQRYNITDDQGADIIAFLRGIPAVSNKITSECPGHGG